MADPINIIRDDHVNASRQSGTRPLSAIKWIVIHDAEVDDPELGAEKVDSYFESAAAKGSTHYGVDNDSTQRYLPDSVIPWGARGANTNGLHIELMGKASHSREEWLSHHGPMFVRAGWLIAAKAKRYGIPIRLLTVAEFKAGKKGVVTHALISQADGPGGSTHTDPGPDFPMGMLLAKALSFFATGTEPLPAAKLPLLRLGSVGGAVRVLQADLRKRRYRIAIDGEFGDETRDAVIAWQRSKHLEDDGIVGPDTWKSLGH